MVRALLLVSAVAVLVSALPQNIDFDAVKDAVKPSVQGPPATGQSQVPTYAPSKADASVAAAVATDPVSSDSKRSVEKRNACDPQPAGSAPTTSPDTASAFLANTAYTSIEQAAPVPQGYELVFENLQGSTSQNGYLGYYSFSSYDTIQCQQKCDAAAGCTAFNFFIERDPSLEPGPGCDNPPSTNVYKCVLWGLPITNTTATNTGQWRDQFQVVITASNGYVKNDPPPSFAGFTGPTELGGAINAPSGYIGNKFFPGPYNAGQCAAACQSTTQYDSQHPSSSGTYDPCNFFTAYVLSENNSPQGTYCQLYTQPWDRSYATNTGQYDGQGNYYSVSSAYSYTLTQQDPGTVSSS